MAIRLAERGYAVFAGARKREDADGLVAEYEAKKGARGA